VKLFNINCFPLDAALKTFKERNLDDLTLSKWLKQTFPVLDWVPKYDWKVDGPCDLIAGITVGIMHIPQGKQ